MPVPLVIDTDPGVDDMLALLVAASSPEVDIRAITTTYGNVDLAITTRNAQRIMGLAGRHDVPVIAGSARPLVRRRTESAADIHGGDGLGGKAGDLPDNTGAVGTDHAVDVMARVIEESSTAVTLVVLGPATNAALFLARYPDLATRLERIIMMGGAIAGGNVSAVSEFNIACDPEAAERVFSDAVPTWMVGLDVTNAVRVDQDWMDALSRRGHCAATAMAVMQHYMDRARRRGREQVAVHDAVVLAELIAPGTVRFDAADITVETGAGPARGCTVVARRAESSHRVAVDVDHAAAGLIAERIATAGTET